MKCKLDNIGLIFLLYVLERNVPFADWMSLTWRKFELMENTF